MAPNKIYCEQQTEKSVTNIGAAMYAKITGRISTRSQSNICQPSILYPEKKGISKAKDTLSKRKADQLSPPKGKTTKRSALVDIINDPKHIASKGNQANKKNAINKENKVQNVNAKQKEIVKISTIAEAKVPAVVNLKPATKTANLANIENVDPNTKAKPVKQNNVVSKQETKQTNEMKESDIKFDSIHKVTSSGKLANKFRRSLDTCHDRSDESSLYTSALEDV